jgi:hypothetical protein
MKRRFMPRDFFQYLVEVRRVFVAAKRAGCFDESGGLIGIIRSRWALVHRPISTPTSRTIPLADRTIVLLIRHAALNWYFETSSLAAITSPPAADNIERNAGSVRS